MLPSHTYSDNTLINLATARYTPRWIVVCIEVCLLSIALYLSFFVVEPVNNSIVIPKLRHTSVMPS